jgi:ABC-type amino acid transport system permease subunit
MDPPWPQAVSPQVSFDAAQAEPIPAAWRRAPGRRMTANPLLANGQSYKPLASVIALLSAIFMIMPVRRVVIEVSESGLRELFVPVLILVGLPVLGALVGAFLRFQGPGGRFLGITLGIFVASLLLVALLAYWWFYSITTGF